MTGLLFTGDNDVAARCVGVPAVRRDSRLVLDLVHEPAPPGLGLRDRFALGDADVPGDVDRLRDRAGAAQFGFQSARPACCVLLLLGTTVTSLTAMAPWYIVEPKYVQFVKMIVALLLTASLLTEVRRIHALIWAIVISLGYYGVKGGAFAILTGGEYRVFGPAASMIEDNNHLAAALLVTLPLMNYLRLHSAHALVRVGLLGAMGLTLLPVVASYSRGALLGLGAV